MACGRCIELNTRYAIEYGRDLLKAIAVARDNLADGTLRGIPGGSCANPDQPPFADIVAGTGKWDDFLCYRFQCTHCGQRFELASETYHGSGGAWKPISADAP